MKSLLIAALALPATLSAVPELGIQFTIYLQDQGIDPLGLSGSSFTFELYSTEGQYEGVSTEAGILPAFSYYSMSVTIADSDSLDGTYSLKTIGGTNNHYGISGVGGGEPNLFAPLFPAAPGEQTHLAYLEVGTELFFMGPLMVAAQTPAVMVGDSIQHIDYQNLTYSLYSPTVDLTVGETLLPYAISLTPFAAVPEPSTYAALLGLGAFGFAAWRRRK
ncbi:MAG: PEP-CTERM sorting domain-containing protein [Verrucomicrobiota bacterium JB022]|nr:PEP-CTERM sorting domain-containing protein [Verrucomicrobiota bacterium JB022]